MVQTDNIMGNHQIKSYNLCTMLISKNSSFESFEWVLDQLSDELKTDIIQVNEDGSPKLLDLALLLGAENIYAGLCEKYYTEDDVTKAVKFFADTLFFNCRININNVIAVLDFVKGGYESSGIELADFQKLSESMTHALDQKFAWQFSLLTIEQLENIITTLKGVLNTPNLQGVEEYQVKFFSYPSVQSAMQKIWENTPVDKREDKFKGIIWEPTVDLSVQSSTSARVSEHSFLSQDSYNGENLDALPQKEINSFTQ